jgi:hypothetical protein
MDVNKCEVLIALERFMKNLHRRSDEMTFKEIREENEAHRLLINLLGTERSHSLIVAEIEKRGLFP